MTLKSFRYRLNIREHSLYLITNDCCLRITIPSIFYIVPPYYYPILLVAIYAMT